MPRPDAAGAADLLLIDSNPHTHRLLRPALDAAGYRIAHAISWEAARTLLAARPPAIVLAPAIVLVDAACFAAGEPLAHLRAATAAPIVVMFVRADEPARIRALDAGADDVVDRSIPPGELLARLRACRRRAAESGSRQLWRCPGGVQIELTQRSAAINGQPISLSPTEFDILSLLVRNAGHVMTHRQLLTGVWGPGHRQDIQYLRVYIGHLRQKLGPDFAARLHTEAGVGYRLTEEQG